MTLSIQKIALRQTFAFPGDETFSELVLPVSITYHIFSFLSLQDLMTLCEIQCGNGSYDQAHKMGAVAEFIRHYYERTLSYTSVIPADFPLLDVPKEQLEILGKIFLFKSLHKIINSEYSEENLKADLGGLMSITQKVHKLVSEQFLNWHLESKQLTEVLRCALNDNQIELIKKILLAAHMTQKIQKNMIIDLLKDGRCATEAATIKEFSQITENELLQVLAYSASNENVLSWNACKGHSFYERITSDQLAAIFKQSLPKSQCMIQAMREHPSFLRITSNQLQDILFDLSSVRALEALEAFKGHPAFNEITLDRVDSILLNAACLGYVEVINIFKTHPAFNQLTLEQIDLMISSARSFGDESIIKAFESHPAFHVPF